MQQKISISSYERLVGTNEDQYKLDRTHTRVRITSELSNIDELKFDYLIATSREYPRGLLQLMLIIEDTTKAKRFNFHNGKDMQCL